MINNQLDAELAVKQLRIFYDRIPEPDRRIVLDSARILSAGIHPRRVWVYVPDPRDGEPFEIE